MMKTRIFTYLAIAITLCLFHSTSLSAQKRPPVLNPPQRLPVDPLNLRQPKPKAEPLLTTTAAYLLARGLR